MNLLLRSKEVLIDRADLMLQTQRRYAAGGVDFADGLIERIAHAQGCAATMTFVSGAARSAGMTLMP